MAVAKSYEKFPLEGSPFRENGRMYVNVTTPKGSKKVRWYTDAERARMDKTSGAVTKEQDVMDFNARYAFGFGNAGFITIYRGNESEIEKWADDNHQCTRHNLTFGYYTPSYLQPENVPSTITPVRLEWEEIMDNGDKMKPHTEVIKIVSQKLGGIKTGLSMSVFQGTIGGWIQREITVTDNKKKSSVYGDSHEHMMVDKDGNLYKWTTGTKDLKIGSSLNMKMRVKSHEVIRGANVTLVYYCKEI